MNRRNLFKSLPGAAALALGVPVAAEVAVGLDAGGADENYGVAIPKLYGAERLHDIRADVRAGWLTRADVRKLYGLSPADLDT